MRVEMTLAPPSAETLSSLGLGTTWTSPGAVLQTPRVEAAPPDLGDASSWDLVAAGPPSGLNSVHGLVVDGMRPPGRAVIGTRSAQRVVLVAAGCLVFGCYQEEVPYDPSRHFAVERWTVRDNTTDAVLAQGCQYTSREFAFEAEPGQLLTLEVLVEGFSVADWSAVPHEQEYWCAKKGQSPTEGVNNPAYWAETPLNDSCKLRRSVNIISTRLLPEGADPDRLLTATGYEVVMEVVRKGPFCVPCPGDPYSACTKILVQ